ncbi:MAG: amino acid ABC transporter permease [Leptolyngbya sp. IPPAS B-1204]|uniref:Amino acid ABC transporter permease n=1 Tax=Leptolyngbya sp. NK1-12 TaxID=2547451 RepID=A0AA96WFD5_9CYAN|nr:amino acid ABC transporter permease [Leptolyngbya sp. NK1-12]MBF2047741.1 amino acid ABC transporter permease [Elainella sp. C42_A2020_010]RNJ68931.1 MAG: amino acid ABC transporter permease [Leptolyngbya sp. IPPAS B-1204]WNZ24024.1 amino acid ABC transporter permease [Leptolyngbya sp. NK1-12]
MTTILPQSSAPPVTAVGPWAWAKKNLFSSWLNTLLTIISAAFLAWVLITLLSWAFTEAQWNAVRDNFRLFLVGRYPVQLLWRIWASLGLIVAVGGLSWGVLARTSRLFDRRGLVMLGILAASILIVLGLLADPTSIAISLGLLVLLVGTAFLGQQIGQVKPQLGSWLPLFWLLTFLLAYALVRGLIIGPQVKLDDLTGLLLTLLTAIVSIVLSFPIGVLLALGRRSELPVIRWLSIVYIEVIRGLPLVTILFAASLLVPLVLPSGMRPDRVLRAIVGLTMFSAAYLAENVRGGLQSVPRGQAEAAKALGMNPLLTTTLIVLPQALKAVIPTIVGQFISLFKDTSLLAIIGLAELLGMGQSVLANPQYNGRSSEVFLFIGLIYFLCCSIMSWASRRLERQLNAPKRAVDPALTTNRPDGGGGG